MNATIQRGYEYGGKIKLNFDFVFENLTKEIV